MKQLFFILAISLLMAACNEQANDEKPYFLYGAWTLRLVEYPTGKQYPYPMANGETYCRIYDRDSTFYECILTKSTTGLIVVPNTMCGVTIVDKGNGEMLYLEDDNPRPLTIVDDTTVCIQRNGVLFTWRRADDICLEWDDEIRDIIANSAANKDSSDNRCFVLSAKERQQASTIHWLVYTISFILLFALQYVITSQRSKRRLRLQLRQIQEEHTERALSVRQAMKSEEEHFFASDEYAALQRRMVNGSRMKDTDWQQAEQQLRTVYPGFTSQLRGLYPMSELEYQVCLLIKLRIAPKDIAAVLSRDVSTISTVRSRLYKKVFGRKGSTREWDDFILSIGA